jgi:hypothetical protein
MTMQSLRQVGLVAVIACALGYATAADSAASNVGWVWADEANATSAYTPPAASSYNSRGGAITVTPLGTGEYEVSFAKLYDGNSDNIEVTGFQTSGYCTSAGWTPSGKTLNAYVHCFDAGGNRANSTFTLLYQSRNALFGSYNTGLAFVWASCPTACASYTPGSAYSYNSSGGTNTIARNVLGNYTVVIPGISKYDGAVQVTAYGSNAARCTLDGFGPEGGFSTQATVQCFDGTGAPADEMFDLAFSRGQSFGLTKAAASHGTYALADKDAVTTAYTPLKPAQYNGFGTGFLTAQKTSKGNYTVTLPGDPQYLTSNVLVTASIVGPATHNYCNVAGWGGAALYIACYAPGGGFVDSQFDVAFQSVPLAE